MYAYIATIDSQGVLDSKATDYADLRRRAGELRSAKVQTFARANQPFSLETGSPFRPRLPKGPALRLSQRAVSAKLGEKLRPLFFAPRENLQKRAPRTHGCLIVAAWGRKHFFFQLRRARLFRPRLPKAEKL